MNHEVAKHTAALGVIVVAIVACATGQSQSATTPADALLDVLVFGTHAAVIDAAAYPADVRARVSGYLQRSKQFVTRLQQDKSTSGLEEMVRAAAVEYEKKIAAFSDDARAPSLAAAYVQALRPCYEWEGFHDCPEREAEFAAAYLASHPGGPFDAYLPLLAAHRWLCAAEAYRYEADRDGEAAARRGYEAMLPRARRSSDPMIRAAADRLASRGTCQ